MSGAGPRKSETVTHPDGWSIARVDLIKKLWTVDGLSAAEIAKQLGGLTRSAVLGKLYRCGLTGESARVRCRPADPVTKTISRVPPSKPRSVAKHSAGEALAVSSTSSGAVEIARTPYSRSAPPLDGQPRRPRVVVPFREEAPGTRTIMTIGFAECRWPSGNPPGDDFTMCGRHAPDGPYCPTHRKLSTARIQPGPKPTPYAARGG